MNAALSFLVAGRTAPAPPESMTSTAPGRPWQLDDRDWLSRALITDGERSIALQLGVSRGTVRRARVNLGIPAPAEGRRRGTRGATTRPDAHAAFQVTNPTGLLIAARLHSESRTSGPAPSEGLLAARIRGAHEARLAGDTLAYEDALVSIASAAGLIHQHQQRLRRAA